MIDKIRSFLIMRKVAYLSSNNLKLVCYINTLPLRYIKRLLTACTFESLSLIIANDLRIKETLEKEIGLYLLGFKNKEVGLITEFEEKLTSGDRTEIIDLLLEKQLLTWTRENNMERYKEISNLSGVIKDIKNKPVKEPLEGVVEVLAYDLLEFDVIKTFMYQFKPKFRKLCNEK